MGRREDMLALMNTHLTNKNKEKQWLRWNRIAKLCSNFETTNTD